MAQTNTETIEQKVYKTEDYTIFKGIVGNREVKKAAVNRMVESLQAENLLEDNPIKVTDDMRVIDGQTRLKAAQVLRFPIYYRIIRGGDLEMVQRLNAYAKPWITGDYLDSYVALGKKDYIEVKEFAEQYRISISIAIHILGGTVEGGTTSRRTMHAFRSGNFKVKDRAEAERVASLLGVIREHTPDGAWRHFYCVRAAAILQQKGYARKFEQQLVRYGTTVTRRQSTKDYLKEFENIIGSGDDGEEVILR